MTHPQRPWPSELHLLLRQFPLIDGHNDVPWQFHRLGKDPDSIPFSKDTRRHKMVTDIPRLRGGGVGAQFWSVYVPATLTGTEAVKATLEQIDIVYELVARYPETFK